MTKEDELQATLALVRSTMEKCQDENQKLIEGYRFYADPASYVVATGAVWEPIMEDDGRRAREILKEVVGYE